MANVIENFFVPLRRSFLVPTGCEPSEFASDLQEYLGGYSDHQLAEAVSYLKRNRTQRTFPTIAECRQACERFAVAPSIRPAGVRKWKSPEEERSDAIRQKQREQDGAALCRTWPVARQAHREGWLTTLLEFAEDNLREPTEFEFQRLMAKAEKTDANLHREPKPQNYTALCNLRAAMKQRAAERIWGREETAPRGELVTGRAAPMPGRKHRPGHPPEGMTEEQMRQWHLEKLKAMAIQAGNANVNLDRIPDR